MLFTPSQEIELNKAIEELTEVLVALRKLKNTRKKSETIVNHNMLMAVDILNKIKEGLMPH